MMSNKNNTSHVKPCISEDKTILSTADGRSPIDPDDNRLLEEYENNSRSLLQEEREELEKEVEDIRTVHLEQAREAYTEGVKNGHVISMTSPSGFDFGDESSKLPICCAAPLGMQEKDIKDSKTATSPLSAGFFSDEETKEYTYPSHVSVPGEDQIGNMISRYGELGHIESKKLGSPIADTQGLIDSGIFTMHETEPNIEFIGFDLVHQCDTQDFDGKQGKTKSLILQSSRPATLKTSSECNTLTANQTPLIEDVVSKSTRCNVERSPKATLLNVHNTDTSPRQDLDNSVYIRNENQAVIQNSKDIDNSIAFSDMHKSDTNGNLTYDSYEVDTSERTDNERSGVASELHRDVSEPSLSSYHPQSPSNENSGCVKRSSSDYTVGRYNNGVEVRASTSTNGGMTCIDSESETQDSWERAGLYSTGCETVESLDSLTSTTIDSDDTDTESGLDEDVGYMTTTVCHSTWTAGLEQVPKSKYDEYQSKTAKLWVARSNIIHEDEESNGMALAELYKFTVTNTEALIIGLPVFVRLKVFPQTSNINVNVDDISVRALNSCEICIQGWTTEFVDNSLFLVIHILPLFIDTCSLVIMSRSNQFRRQTVPLEIQGNNPLMSFTEGTDWPIALATDPPVGAVVVAYPHHIVRFTEDGEFIEEILRDPRAYFNDIAIHKDAQLIVVSLSDWIVQMGQKVRNQALRLYDVNGQILWVQNDNPEFMLVPVLHMTFDSNANVIVAAKNCIAKCSKKTGAFEVQLPLDNFGTASRLVMSKNERVLLLDGTMCHVHILHENLTLLTKIKLDLSSSAVSISNGWSGLSVDRNGFVFVTNCVDNAVVIYTMDGKRVGFIESEWDEVGWPLGIAASADSHVFVVDHRHACIKKFAYHQLKVTWLEEQSSQLVFKSTKD